MRHVSRTHSVALDWLFDRINLDSKIQIRHIDSKHQLADILTKERDEWNNLLHLFNISHFSCTCCAKISSLISCAKTMAERLQEGNESSAKAEKYDRTGQPVVGRYASHESVHHHKQFVEISYSARYSGWDDDKAWSSQEWKADPPMGDRTGQPVVTSWWKAHDRRPCCSSSFGRTIMGKANWENPIETLLGENSKVNVSLFIVKKDYSYLCMWMT